MSLSTVIAVDIAKPALPAPAVTLPYCEEADGHFFLRPA
jgi:hypothetical protein